MAFYRVKLIYPQELVDQPIIYELGKNFDVATNIRRAEINSNHGWLLADLRGDEAAINGAIAWLEQRGIEVQKQEA